MTERGSRYIPENPGLHVGNLFAHRMDAGLFRRFYGRDAGLFYFGRGALLHAVESLRLSARDNILVPAYHCGVEIEAVSMAGVQLRYFDVQDDFSVELSDLRSRIDADTRAILLIHYFGFPQPVETIKAICRERNIMLIEDCCQALFSCCNGQPLGTFGDIAVFSQRKTLPIPDGGALLVNNAGLSPVLPAGRPSEPVAGKKVLGMLFRAAFNLDPHNELPYPLEQAAALFNRRIARNTGVRYSTGMEMDRDRCSLAMSGISKGIMNRTGIDHVIRRRRENYTFLLGRLSDTLRLKIVRKQLPEGVCPLFFPVKVEGGSRHDLQERLRIAGIGTFVFGEKLHPSLPKDSFRNAEMLSHDILCLPVHQDLNHEEMSLLAAAVLQSSGELDNADPH